ncbi:GNAT family N-acetyltransferase [Lysobacter sp. A3-1-A15]|uniref:GNAT family N-acetyltransferase n=1 Tax=Novilysobacter viscosus TaxID=3098602 RepID=UPI002ED9BC0A
MPCIEAPAHDDSDALPRLAGGGVLLRGFRGDDADALFALHSDPRAMRYWSFAPWTDRSQVHDYLARAIAARDPDRMLCWVVTQAGDDALVGTTTLFAIDRVQGRAEVGYALRPSHWGRGLATGTLGLVLGHAFDTLGLRRVEADIDPRNAASCRLVERQGFVREGLLRERWHVGGETCDSAVYGLLAREWVGPPSAAPVGAA